MENQQPFKDESNEHNHQELQCVKISPDILIPPMK